MNKPVRVVILVDESGSLAPEDVKQERDAAAILATGELSPESEVAVIGFGSANGPGQKALDTVCPLAKVTDAQREHLTTCVGDLRRRESDEGNDTDYVSAIEQALALMAQQTDGLERSGIIFLLTDGVLDVANSTRYGRVAGDRTRRAQQELDEQLLPRARNAGVQIWPLGFGQVDSGALEAIATGGFQTGCSDRPESKPTATTVESSSDVVRSLFRAFAGARCAAVTDPVIERLESGSSTDLFIRIPEITTDGTIQVIKGDPRVRVSFFGPDKAEVPKNGKLGESTFEGVGESANVESLRIGLPQSGEWRVHVEAGPEVPASEVSAIALWQGALSTDIVLEPPSPQAGQKVVLRSRILTRSGQISDPEALRGLNVTATLTGDGFQPVTGIVLRDDGTDPDVTAADGSFAATVDVPPAASGALEFTAVASATGVASDSRPYPTSVATGTPPIIAKLDPDPATVAPGEAATVKVILESAVTEPVRVGLKLEADKGSAMTVDPGFIDVPGSGRIERDVRVVIAPNSSEGRATGRLSVTSPEGAVYGSAHVSIPVAEPPGLLARYWWALVIVLALLVLAAVYVLVRVRADREARKVSGLTLLLWEGDESRGRLQASAEGGPVFPFSVKENGTDPAALARPSGTDRVYEARRAGPGAIYVITPDKRRVDVRRKGSPTPLTGRYSLSYEDNRHDLSRPGQREKVSPRQGPPGPGERRERRDHSWDGLGDPYQT